MTYKAFFDTNVLAYEFEQRDLRKRDIARELLREWRSSGRMVLSVQVLQELYVVLTRKMGISEKDAEEIIKNYAKLPIISADSDLVLRGIEISQRYKVSFWDALLIAAALRGNCRIIFTEDLSHGAKIEGVEIVNPFGSEPPAESSR